MDSSDPKDAGLNPPAVATPDFKINQDVLKIRTLPFDDVGEKIEPEQQLVNRHLTIAGGAPVGTRGGQELGSIPAEIIVETSAGEVANAMRSQCWQCKHFDAKAWEKLRLYWGNSSDKFLFNKLNGVRLALMQTTNAEMARRSTAIDGDFDVEHALRSMGICRPLTELNNDAVIVSPLSHCPPEVCSAMQPNGLFTPKDKEVEHVGNTAYDHIMRAAQGKGQG